MLNSLALKTQTTISSSTAVLSRRSLRNRFTKIIAKDSLTNIKLSNRFFLRLRDNFTIREKCSAEENFQFAVFLAFL